MSHEAPETPPEADVIRLARKAAGLTAESAARATKEGGRKGIGATYWRDVERGHGWRRGERVTARAADETLAVMALVVGATPPQLTEAGREDAARVLEEMLRRSGDRVQLTAVPPPLALDELTEEDVEPLLGGDELYVMILHSTGFTLKERLHQIAALDHERKKYRQPRNTDTTGSTGAVLTVR
jgi:hypothetical protein